MCYSTRKTGDSDPSNFLFKHLPMLSEPRLRFVHGRGLSTNKAYEQLAIYYEHRAREPEQARQVASQAVAELRRALQVGDITPGAYREFKARFDRRMQRLERKSRRPLLDGLAIEAQA